jgi:hypothetical protein
MDLTNEPVSRKQLWIGVGVGPVVWAAHLTIIYAILSVSCHWGFLQGSLFGITFLRLLLVLLTLLAGAGILAAGWMAYGNYRRLSENRRRNGGDPTGRVIFMTQTGAMMSALFLFGVVMALVPILVLDLCAGFWW